MISPFDFLVVSQSLETVVNGFIFRSPSALVNLITYANATKLILFVALLQFQLPSLGSALQSSNTH